MGKRNKRKPPARKDAVSKRGRPPRKSDEVTPAEPQEAALETYEQSPERPGGDERSRPATPDGPMPDRENATPD